MAPKMESFSEIPKNDIADSESADWVTKEREGVENLGKRPSEITTTDREILGREIKKVTGTEKEERILRFYKRMENAIGKARKPEDILEVLEILENMNNPPFDIEDLEETKRIVKYVVENQKKLEEERIADKIDKIPERFFGAIQNKLLGLYVNRNEEKTDVWGEPVKKITEESKE